MKRMILLALALLLCNAACAETEAAGPVELMGYIGGPYAELAEAVGEPRNEYEAFLAGIPYYKFPDSYTVYFKDDSLTIRGSIGDDDPDPGWAADTAFYVGLAFGLDDYSLAGCRVGEYFPDVETRLLADGWQRLEQPNEYNDVSFEKTAGDVRYHLDFIVNGYEWEDTYMNITYIGLTGYRAD